MPQPGAAGEVGMGGGGWRWEGSTATQCLTTGRHPRQRAEELHTVTHYSLPITCYQVVIKTHLRQRAEEHLGVDVVLLPHLVPSPKNEERYH